jgi:hypothetical protein
MSSLCQHNGMGLNLRAMEHKVRFVLPQTFESKAMSHLDIETKHFKIFHVEGGDLLKAFSQPCFTLKTERFSTMA